VFRASSRERTRAPVWLAGLVPADDRVVDQQHHDRADYRHEHAVQIEPGDSGVSEERKDVSTDDRAHDSEYDVEDQPLTGFVDDLAADKACD